MSGPSLIGMVVVVSVLASLFTFWLIDRFGYGAAAAFVALQGVLLILVS